VSVRLGQSTPPGLVFEAEEVPTAYIVAKFPSPSMDNPDFPLFSAAMDVVSDRFWQVLRTEQGLTYATYAGTGSSLRNWAYMYVSTPEPAAACSLMVAVVSEGAAGGFTAADIAGSIETARTGRLMSLASVYDLSYLMGLYRIQTGDWRNLWLYSDIARDMDPAELGGVLSRWLGPVSWGVIADPAVAAPESLSLPAFGE
jgi:predicted Zn-dependent peptidase